MSVLREKFSISISSIRRAINSLTKPHRLVWFRKDISQLSVSKVIEIPFTPESSPLAEDEQRNCLTLVEAGFRARL